MTTKEKERDKRSLAHWREKLASATPEEREESKKRFAEDPDPALDECLKRLGGLYGRELDLTFFIVKTISGILRPVLRDLKEQTSSLASASRVAEAQAHIMSIRNRLTNLDERINGIEEELSRHNDDE